MGDREKLFNIQPVPQTISTFIYRLLPRELRSSMIQLALYIYVQALPADDFCPSILTSLDIFLSQHSTSLDMTTSTPPACILEVDSSSSIQLFMQFVILPEIWFVNLGEGYRTIIWQLIPNALYPSTIFCRIGFTSK